MAQLKKLAITCKFGVLHDELVRDQIIMHTVNTSIQEKLWVNGDSPLNEIIAMVKKAELSKRCAEAAKLDKYNKATICKVGETNTQVQRGSMTRGRGQQGGNPRYMPRTNYAQKQGSRDNTECYRCGSNRHAAYDRRCPAFRAKCLYCGIM